MTDINLRYKLLKIFPNFSKFMKLQGFVTRHSPQSMNYVRKESSCVLIFIFYTFIFTITQYN